MGDRMTFAGGRKSENTRQRKDSYVRLNLLVIPFTGNHWHHRTTASLLAFHTPAGSHAIFAASSTQ